MISQSHSKQPDWIEIAGAEAIGMGTVDDGAAREDWGGVEEEGEERGVSCWAAGGDAEGGEAGAVPARVLRRLPVPDAGREAG